MDEIKESGAEDPQDSLTVDKNPPFTAAKPASSGIPWGLASFLVLVILIAAFAVQNPADTEINFLGWSWQFPLALVIIAVVAVSVVLDEILGAVLRRRRRRRRADKHELRELRSRQP